MSGVTIALRRALRALPGGIARAARDADMAESTLYNKLNAECPTHRLTFSEFRELAHPERCASTAPIQALCNEFGGVFVRTAPAVGASAGALAGQLAGIAKEFSEFLGEVSSSAGDGVITDAELARTEKEYYELAAVGAETIARMRALNDAYHIQMSALAQDARDAHAAALRAQARIG